MRALAIVLALAGAAHADAVKPPVGWQLDDVASQGLTTKANQLPHFGGIAAVATAQVYMPPAPGVALFVTSVAGKTTEREAAARVAVDELHATSQRAALAGGSGMVEDHWEEKVEGNQVTASLAWRDPAGTATTARLVVAADTEHVVAVTGECVAGDGADAKELDACKAALATLDPGLAKRVQLALAPPGTRPTPPAAAEPHTPLPPIAVRQEDRSPDRRPVYVGAAIVVLAAAFWWMRRRKQS